MTKGMKGVLKENKGITENCTEIFTLAFIV